MWLAAGVCGWFTLAYDATLEQPNLGMTCESPTMIATGNIASLSMFFFFFFFFCFWESIIMIVLEVRESLVELGDRSEYPIEGNLPS